MQMFSPFLNRSLGAVREKEQLINRRYKVAHSQGIQDKIAKLDVDILHYQLLEVKIKSDFASILLCTIKRIFNDVPQLESMVWHQLIHSRDSLKFTAGMLYNVPFSELFTSHAIRWLDADNKELPYEDVATASELLHSHIGQEVVPAMIAVEVINQMFGCGTKVIATRTNIKLTQIGLYG